MTDLLKEHIPKKNTLDSYCRTIQQVYDYLKIENVLELLPTKEQDIINYLEKKYESISTIKASCVRFMKSKKY
jgi:site-specific recombinase XerD